MGGQEKVSKKTEIVSTNLTEVTINANKSKLAPNIDTTGLMEASMVCDTEPKGVKVRDSITQTNGGDVMENNNIADFYHGKMIYVNQALSTANNSSAASILNEVTTTKSLRSAVNSNTIDLMEVFRMRDVDTKKQLGVLQIKTIQTDSDSSNEVSYNTVIFTEQDKYWHCGFRHASH